MIILIGNTKGGVGKSTIAALFSIYLSRKYENIMLIDGDDQGSIMDFSEIRNGRVDNSRITTLGLRGKNIATEVRKSESKYDHIVIDCGGKDGYSIRSALVVADMVVSPFNPDEFSIWDAERFAVMIEEAKHNNEKLFSIAFLNKADQVGDDNGDALECLAENLAFDIVLKDQIIKNRKPVKKSVGMGLYPDEYFEFLEKTDKKKANVAKSSIDNSLVELSNLFDVIHQHMEVSDDY